MNKFQYKVQGVDYDVEIEELEGNVAKVQVNGIKFEVDSSSPSTLPTPYARSPRCTNRHRRLPSRHPHRRHPPPRQPSLQPLPPAHR